MGTDGIRVNNPAVPLVGQPPTGTGTALPVNAPAVPPPPVDAFTQPADPRRPTLTGETTASASVEIGPDGVAVEAEAALEVRGPRGFGVRFEAGTQLEERRDVHSEDGFTTYTVTRDLSVTVSGEVEAGAIGFGAEQTQGVNTTYQVRMTDEAYAQLQAGQIPPPDPFHPETMPEGTSIVMNSTDYAETGFSATFQRLQLESGLREEQGVSVQITAGEGGQVTVTAGPTSAIEESFRAGLDLGIGSVHLGSTSRVDNLSLRTATFDPQDLDGRAAYEAFLVTGALPQDNGPGITDVARIEQLTAESGTTAGGSLGPFEVEFDLAQSAFDQVVTTFPDGSQTQETALDHHAGVPVRLEQTFLPDGSEDLSQQRFTVTLPAMHPATAAYLNQAFGAQPLPEGFPGGDVSLTLTAEEATALSERARTYIAELTAQGVEWGSTGLSPQDQVIDALAQAENSAQVADAIAQAYVTPDALGSGFHMLWANDPTGALPPLPGTVDLP